MEKSVFATADAVECAWTGIIKDALGKYPDLDATKFIHVPNGFDSDDLPRPELIPNKRFTITYTGSMYGRRNPASLFEAVEKLIASGKVNPDNILLRFVGRFGAEVEEMFAGASFKSSIEVIGYVPHGESIKLLMLSDALLLVVDESKESEEIVPGKVYEYLGCRRPILAIAPQKSAIAELMNETGSGRTAVQTEIELIADIFLDLYEDFINGVSKFKPDEASINKYERREAAKRLAEILDGICGFGADNLPVRK